MTVNDPNLSSNQNMDFGIEIESTTAGDQPVNANPYRDPVEVIIEAKAWEQINVSVRENTAYESGGWMLGEIYEFEDRVLIRVTDAVHAKQADVAVTSVNFTPEAWRELDAEIERLRENERGHKLLGWYHTHPNFTAFFSADDYHMHESYFNEPWLVALVIDPIREEYRIYRWEDGRIRDAHHFLLEVELQPNLAQPVRSQLLTSISHGIDSITDSSQAHLKSQLEYLKNNLKNGTGKSAFIDLLRFMVDVNQMDDEFTRQANTLIAESLSRNNAIQTNKLRRVMDVVPDQPIPIIDKDWYVQAYNRTNLRVLNTKGDIRLPLSVRLPVTVLSLAITEQQHVLIMGDDTLDKLRMLTPRLPVLERRLLMGHFDEVRARKVKLDWRGTPIPGNVNQLIVSRNLVFLVAPDQLYIFQYPKATDKRLLSLMGIAKPGACQWKTFDLRDWCVDPSGDLFLLGSDGAVWKFEHSTRRWLSMVQAGALASPRLLAADWSYLNVYDDDASVLYKYNIHDRRPSTQREIEQNDSTLEGVQKMYTDGNWGLFFATPNGIFRAD